MNMNAGTVVWNLDLNSKDFDKQLKNSEKQVGNFSKSIDRSVNASKAFAKTLTGVAIAGLGVASMAIKSAMETENLRKNFDILTGSMESGGKMFKEVYDFASKTPFETKELAQATSTMLAFGIANEKVMPFLQQMGDISLGNKEKLGGLSLAFSQVQSTGRLMGQDLLQMVNVGFNPLQIISEKTGKTMVQLKAEMEKGQISVKMVEDAMKDATSEGGRFYKGMEIGATSLSGVWSTLSDAFGMLMRGLVGLNDEGQAVEGGLFDRLKTALQALTDWITANKQKIIDFVNETFGWMETHLPEIATIIFTMLIPAFTGLAVSLWATYFPLIPWIALAGLLIWAGRELQARFGGWSGIMEKLQPIIEALQPVLELFRFMLDRIVQLVKDWIIPELKKLWDLLGPDVVKNIKYFAIALGVLLVGAIAVVIIIIGAILIVIGLFITILTKLAEINEWVKNKIKAVWDWIYNYLVGNSVIPDLINGISGWFAKLPQMIASGLSGLWSAIVTPFKSAFDEIGKQAEKVYEKLKKINPFNRNSPSLVDNIKAGVSVISREYGKLDNLNFSPVASMGVYQSSPQEYTGGGNSNITLNIGMYAGSEIEKREIARQIFQAHDDYQKGKGALI